MLRTPIACALIVCGVLLTNDVRAGTCAPDWHPSFGGAGADSIITTLAVNPDDPTHVVIGGGFATVDGVSASRIAEWRDGAWRALGVGTNGTVRALAWFDAGDGRGPLLHAGGLFTQAGGAPAPFLARWTGSAWESVGGGANDSVLALTVHDDGSGPALYVGGQFTSIGGVSVRGVARWDGTAFSKLVGSVVPTGAAASGLTSATVAGQSRLFMTGEFIGAGGVAAVNVASWDGSAWSPLGAGLNAFSRALMGHDDHLYVGGRFSGSGATAMSRIARWDGAMWEEVGLGVDQPSDAEIFSLATFDDGSGERVLMAGDFFRASGNTLLPFVASLGSGGLWEPSATGLDAEVRAIAAGEIDGSPALFVAGDFSDPNGVGAGRIAAWLGCASGAPADLNGDGVVNAADLAQLLGSWGAGSVPADLNGDGMVNAGDLAQLLGSWTTGPE